VLQPGQALSQRCAVDTELLGQLPLGRQGRTGREDAVAVEVLTGLPAATAVTSLPALQEVLRRINPKSLHLAAFHPTGTAAAGADEQRCPVDETGRLRGVDGIWVADASILPSCPEVNPQVSIMALAVAVADKIVAALPYPSSL